MEDVAGSVAVLVDNERLVKLCSLNEGARGRLDLTTIEPYQHRAEVQLFFVSGTRRQAAHTFRLQQTGDPVRKPRIVLSAECRAELDLRLDVNGALVSHAALAVPRPFVGVGTGRLALIATLVAILALGVLGLLRISRPTDEAGLERAAQTERNVAESPASQQQATPPEPPQPEPARSQPAPEPPQPEPSAPTPAAASPSNAGGATPGTAVPPTSEVPPAARSSLEAPPVPAAAATLPTTTVYFEADSAAIVPATAAALVELRPDLDGRRGTVIITGHTAIYGNEAGRVELSRVRAEAVLEVLSPLPDGLTAELVAMGGQRPVVEDERGQWRNRRVELRFEPIADE